MDIQKRKHAGVLTIGILQIVFGIIGLGCDVFAVSGVSEMWAKNQPAAPGQLSQAEIQDIMEKEMPNQTLFKWVNTGIDTILSLLMLVSGIALVKMISWGRPITIVYAIVSILNRIYSIVFAILFTLPAMDAVVAAMKSRAGPNTLDVSGIMKASTYAGLVFAVLIIAYPITVLVIMNLKSVKAAFAGVPLDSFHLPEDFRDRHDSGPSGEGDERFRQGPNDRYQK